MLFLAATDFSTRSQRAVRRAGLLAQAYGAELALVHVVDDDQPQDLVALETREAQRILNEQITVVSELQHVTCRSLVVAGDAFDGILRTAGSIQPDLIVMGAHRKQLLLDIFVGTTIERVIRNGSWPVLMVNKEGQDSYRAALAAIDTSEASANAIRTAKALKIAGDAHLTFVHAFHPMAKGQMFVAGLSKAAIDGHVGEERVRATKDVVEILGANGVDAYGPSLFVEEGTPFEVIKSAVERLRPDLLVVGTHARTGLTKAFLGSVSEEALRSLEIDILAVPPKR
ncbi:MAG: universal stress protein [Microvirga sp.]|jgi:nucleotide-binding universal stress UspA family protein|nr:universal stress protein [Geminicoccaceae bacterium]MDF2765470.1 universal stress protein [Rhodospirillales bacterium]MDF2969631.1 universal stress protein [Microvirga sp.]